MKEIKSLENRGILLKGTTSKITSQEGGFLNFYKPLMTAGLTLMKNVLTPSAKRALIPLGLTVATSATDTAIQKKNFGSSTTALIISKEEMEYIIKIVKSLQESGLLIIKQLAKQLKINQKNKKADFFNCY